MSETQTAPAQATPKPGEQQTPQTTQTPAAATAAPATTTTTQQTPDPKAAEVTYDLKLPDGAHLDPSAVEGIVSFAKSKGLAPDVAQALLERDNANFAATVQAIEQGQKKMLQDEQARWIEEAKKDPEIGGDGFAKNVELAKRLVASVAPELSKDIEDSGYGNHPGFLKLMVRFAKKANITEDSLVVANANSAGGKSLEDIFYPNSSKETQ